MSKYLINVTETYRIDSEGEVEQILEEAKQSKDYELTKYNCTYKESKKNGEIIDFWYKVSLTKSFNAEKEPESIVTVNYTKGEGENNNAF